MWTRVSQVDAITLDAAAYQLKPFANILYPTKFAFSSGSVELLKMFKTSLAIKTRHTELLIAKMWKPLEWKYVDKSTSS